MFFRKLKGFTILELLVSSTVILILFSFVLASFRTGRYSGEINVVTKQIISGITIARTKTLGGEIFQSGFPAGGYGINFDAREPSQYILFADTDDNGSFTGDVSDPGGSTETIEVGSFRDISIVSVCGLDANQVLELPCTGSGWSTITSPFFLEIIFTEPGQIAVNYANPQPGDSFDFVGLQVRHQKTGQEAYIYVSILSGLVTGDLY